MFVCVCLCVLVGVSALQNPLVSERFKRELVYTHPYFVNSVDLLSKFVEIYNNRPSELSKKELDAHSQAQQKYVPSFVVIVSECV